MRLSPTFWAAFWAGLAAPASLYAPPPPYMAYVGGYSVPQAFGVVGIYLSQASGRILDVGRSITEPAGS